MTESSTYRQISELSTQLRTETRITARREAARNVISLLSDSKVRAKLAREAFLASVASSGRRRQRRQQQSKRRRQQARKKQRKQRHRRDADVEGDGDGDGDGSVDVEMDHNEDDRDDHDNGDGHHDDTDHDDNGDAAIVLGSARRLLATTWRLLISNALQAVTLSMESKRSKLSKEDVILPYRLLVLCDHENDNDDEAMMGSPARAGGSSGVGNQAKFDDDDDDENMNNAEEDDDEGDEYDDDEDEDDDGEPRTSPFFLYAPYRGAGMSQSKLSGREILALLRFCLDVLGNNDDALAVAETDLLAMLHHLCSRPEYVACFHPQRDVNFILSEITRRLQNHTSSITALSSASSSASSSRTMSTATSPTSSHSLLLTAKTLASLAYQCAFRLGISMQLFAAPCIEVVSSWCHAQNEAAENASGGGFSGAPKRAALGDKGASAAASVGLASQLFPHLFAAVSVLFATHAENCIEVLPKAGKSMLLFAKRCWNTSRGHNRDTLVDYFSSHLHVCEVAGHLTGRNSGDLGPGDLDRTQLHFLLDLVASEREIDLLLESVSGAASSSTSASIMASASKAVALSSSKASSSISRSLGQRRGRAPVPSTQSGRRGRNMESVKRQRRRFPRTDHDGRGNAGPLWVPLTRRHRRHLELCARLLRHTQRYHLLVELFRGVEDPVQTLIDRTYGEEDEGDEDNRGATSARVAREEERFALSSSQLAESPWIMTVAGRLHAVGLLLSGRRSSSGRHRYVTRDELESPNRSKEKEQANPMLHATFSWARRKSSDSQMEVNATSAVPLLQLISACAEYFPAGECWSSRARWKERRDKLRQDGDVATHFQPRDMAGSASSPEDTAAVIHIVTDVLEGAGGAGGDAAVQLWSVLCLLKLTTSSVLCVQSGDDTAEHLGSLRVLGEAWRRVWTILFRPDLRYAAYASRACPRSLGEMVLMLLTEITANSCTDPEALVSTSSNGGTSFLRHAQKDVWDLPLLRDGLSVRSPVAFEFISTVVRNAGLADDGNDVIDRELPEGYVSSQAHDAATSDDTRRRGAEVLGSSRAGRRFRLMCFCLRYVESCVLSFRSGSRRTIPAAIECIFTMMGGCAYRLTTSYAIRAFTTFRISEDSLCSQNEKPLRTEHSTHGIEGLWEDSLHLLHGKVKTDSNEEHVWRILRGLGPRLTSVRPEWNSILCGPFANVNADFVSIPLVEELRKFGLFWIKGCLHSVDGVSLSGDDVEVSDLGSSPNDPNSWRKIRVSSVATLIKCLLAIAAAGKVTPSEFSTLLHDNSDLLLPMMDTIVAEMPRIRKRPTEVVRILIDLHAITFVMTMLAASGGTDLPLLVGRRARKVYEECSVLIAAYATGPRIRRSAPVQQQGRNPRRRSMSDSSEDGDDRRWRSSAVNDDDSDFSDDGHRTVKRKRSRDSIDDQGSSRSEDLVPCWVDWRAAWLSGSIVVMLRPSVESCKVAVSGLLRVTRSDYEAGQMSPSFEICEIEDMLFCHEITCLPDVVEKQSRLRAVGTAVNSDEFGSLLSLLIDQISAIRSMAGAATPYHLYGFRSLAHFVRADGDDEGSATEWGELIDLLHPEGAKSGNSDELKIHRRSLRHRHHLRLRQLNAAITCFLGGGRNFHDVFDETFAESFVVPSLSDMNHSIRLGGAQAVCAALKLLPNQSAIVDNVVDALPPLVSSNDGSKLQSEFKRFLQDRLALASNEMAPLESRAWKDLKHSLNFSAVACFGGVAVATSGDDIVQDMLLEVVDMAQLVPSLELVCLRSFEAIAAIMGFSSTEGLTDENRECMMSHWFSTGAPLVEIPAIVSGPGLLRVAREVAANIEGLDSLADATSDGLETGASIAEEPARFSQDRLRSESARSFVDQAADSFIPAILLLSTTSGSKMKDDAAEEGEKAGGDDTGGGNHWEYLVEATGILTGGESDGDIATVIRAHLQDIYAVALPLKAESCSSQDPSSTQDFGSHVLSLLGKYLSDDIVKKQSQKIAHLVVLRLLRRACRNLSGDEKQKLTPDMHFRAVKHFGEQFLTSVGTGKDMFHLAGSSATECLVHARMWLEECRVLKQFDRTWAILDGICTVIVENVKSKDEWQAFFAIHSLTSLLLNDRFHHLRVGILKLLRDVVSAVLEDSRMAGKDNLVSPVMNRVVMGLFHVHEACQRVVINNQSDGRTDSTIRAKRSFGILGLTEVNDRMDCEDQHSGVAKVSIDDVDTDLSNAMSSCHDLIDFLLSSKQLKKNGGSINLEPFPTRSSSKSHLDSLSRLNPKFSLESLVQNFENDDPNEAGLDSLENIRRFLESCDQWNVSASPHKPAANKLLSTSKESGSLDIGSRSQLARLQRLRMDLMRHFETDSAGASSSDADEVLNQVARELFTLCSSHLPTAVRVAASRCLGEMSSFEGSSDGFAPSVLQKLSSKNTIDDPVFGAKITVLSLLSACFRSESVAVSIVAVDTAKALLRTTEGLKGWKALTDQQAKVLLAPLVSSKKLLRSDLPVLPAYYLRQMFRHATNNRNFESIKDKDWCWSPDLWTFNNETPFEQWITRLVCAMIYCCYDLEAQGSGSRVDREGVEFFRVCLRLCSEDYNVASAIFPALVFDLLARDVSSSSEDSSPAQSASDGRLVGGKGVEFAPGAMNTQITRCFVQLFSSTSTTTNVDDTTSSASVSAALDTRALGVALDALGLLRRATQRGFVLSTKHRPNPSSNPNRVYPDQQMRSTGQSATKPAPTSAKEYNIGLESSPLWNGLPYGVVLRLSGIDVASACVRARRFATGISYAEWCADNCLGGSGAVLQNFETEPHSSVRRALGPLDISGFGTITEATEAESHDTQRVEAISALQRVLQESLGPLRDHDSLDALRRLESHLRLKSRSLAVQEFVTPNPSQQSQLDHLSLQALDAELEMSEYAPHVVDVSQRAEKLSAVAGCFEEMGLGHVVSKYLRGIEETEAGVIWSAHDGDLREKWFHSAWRKLQWQSLNVSTGVSSSQQSGNEAALTGKSVMARSPVATSDFGGYGLSGFNESLHEALLCIRHEDPVGFNERLQCGRRALLETLRNKLGLESLSVGLPDFITKLKLLNDLEDNKDDIFTSRCPHNLLFAWDLVETPGAMTWHPPKVSLVGRMGARTFEQNDFEMATREVTLRCILSRSSEDCSDALAAGLSSHLWKYMIVSRTFGQYEISKGALNRLSNLLSTTDSSPKVAGSCLETMLQLEEAQIQLGLGDPSSAVQAARLIVGNVSNVVAAGGESSEVNGSKALLADALLRCGKWMSAYKTASAKTILRSYLEPAVETALELHKQQDAEKNAKAACDACFTMAEFVAALYDSVQGRVSSLEWKMAGTAAAERRAEVERCEKLLDEARKKQAQAERALRAAKGGKGGKQRASSLQHEAELRMQECRELIMHTSQLRKEVDMDSREREEVESSVSTFLQKSLRSYGTALTLYDAASSHHDASKHVFKMISLWFQNSHRRRDEINANEVMSGFVAAIPSYHFVALTYQIFARIDQENPSLSSLSDETASFQQVVRAVVLRICKEHPYHGIPQLLALSNGDNVGTGVNGRRASTYLENVGLSKVEAARSLLQTLMSEGSEFVSSLVESYSALIESYIVLAMTPTEAFQVNGKIQTKDIPLSTVAGSGRDGVPSLDRCLSRSSSAYPPCVLTKPPILRPSGDYGEGKRDPLGTERVAGFVNVFSLTETGIHRPKIVMCRGSKGGSFKQLVKGEDDIRQDAIMQQVFSTVNNLLSRNRFSRGQKSAEGGISSVSSRDRSPGLSRRLHVITYTIVPLSPASGVLEWVQPTIPFGDYLVDKGRTRERRVCGAHSRYFPGEWGANLCRLHFKNAPPAAKRETFDEICRHFSPAFRFFFVERFAHSLEAWHGARMSYVRSCAVSSMVGHVLGIGDRHSQNILIHEGTGEVVHIDFGIVFEQGKCLATPETVPFRLTRDIVDGMGPCGTEGPFSRAAEETMKVLRENASALLTILSAVVSDPLYRWCISPVKAREKQQTNREEEEDEENGGGDKGTRGKFGKQQLSSSPSDNDEAAFRENENDAASRAISKIHEKLQGYEEGTAGERLSPEGQVQLLINAAKDPDNLCVLFHGWAPWL